MAKEAKARIKINKLLEDSGWVLDDPDSSKINVILLIVAGVVTGIGMNRVCCE